MTHIRCDENPNRSAAEVTHIRCDENPNRSAAEVSREAASPSCTRAPRWRTYEPSVQPADFGFGLGLSDGTRQAHALGMSHPAGRRPEAFRRLCATHRTALATQCVRHRPSTTNR